MRILRNTVARDGSEGFVTMRAEEDDDIYYLYNILEVGDTLEAETIRMVTTESKIGVRDKTRVKTRMTIEVDKIEYDAEQCALRVSGRNVRENEHIRMGQQHTIEVEQGRDFTLTKGHNWDAMRLTLLEDLKEPLKNAEIAALVMQEGLAYLCLLRQSMTKTCAVISRNIPKKKAGNVAFDKAMERFFNDIYAAVNQHLDLNVLKVVLVGSPGFTAEEYLTYMFDRSVREEGNTLHKHRAIFVKTHTSSGYKHAIDEMLSTPSAAERLQDVRAVEDVRVLRQFEDTLMRDPDRACYGLDAVRYAAEHDAIDTLLLTDTLFRSPDFTLRQDIGRLIQQVQGRRQTSDSSNQGSSGDSSPLPQSTSNSKGGKVLRFSSLHSTGERLDSLTGIAALLRFPFPDLDELAEEAKLLRIAGESGSATGK